MYFCTLPFTHLTVNPHGTVVPCVSDRWLNCNGGDLTQQSLEEVWNAPEFQEVRRSILDGSFRHCREQSCPFLRLKVSPVVPRDEVADPYLAEVIAKGEVVLSRPPVSLGLAYDPSCDLACQYCHLEAAQLAPEVVPVARQVHEKVWAQVPYLDDVWLACDGEPFVSSLYFEGMRDFRPVEGHAPRFRLLTNGTHFTPERWDAIAAMQPYIHDIQVNVGAADAATYWDCQRGEFEGLRKNLEFIAGLKAAGAKWPLTYRFVVHQRNYAALPQYIEMARALRADKVCLSRMEPATLPEEEFAKIAVHRQEHPEFFSLMSVLETLPVGGVPEVNVMDFAREILADHRVDLPSPLSFDGFCEALDLGLLPARRAKDVLLTLRRELLAALDCPAVDGEASPFALQARALAEAFRDGRPGPATNGEIAEREMEQGGTYAEAMQAALARAKQGIEAALGVYPRVLLTRVPLAALMEMELDGDPYRAALQERALEYLHAGMADTMQQAAAPATKRLVLPFSGLLAAAANFLLIFWRRSYVLLLLAADDTVWDAVALCLS